LTIESTNSIDNEVWLFVFKDKW